MLSRKPQAAAKHLSTRLNVESLEQRDLMAANVFGNALVVYGTTANDTIAISKPLNFFGPATIAIDMNGSRRLVNAAGITEIRAYGNDGNDLIQNNTNLGMTAYGDAGDDTIIGGSFGDRIFGSAGNDVLFGAGGGDILDGGAGNDRLYGQAGFDYLYGSDGNDYLDAGLDSALIYGGAGYDMNADVVAPRGMNGEDTVQAGSPTCWFLASMSSLARSGYDLAASNRVRHTGENQYEVQLFDASKNAWRWIPVKFDGVAIAWTDAQLPVNTTWGLGGDNAACEGEFYTVLYQRAMNTMVGSASRWPSNAMTMLTGKAAADITPWNTGVYDNFTTLLTAVQNNKPVVASTNDNSWWYACDPRFVAGHAYSVISVNASTKMITLRSPRGYDGGKNQDWNTKDGYVEVSWTDLVKSFHFFTTLK